MSFAAECPFCQILLQNVPRQYAGRSMKCPRCRSYFTLSPLLGPPQRKMVVDAAAVAPLPSVVGTAGDDPPAAMAEEIPDEFPDGAAAAIVDKAAPPSTRPKRPVNVPGALSFFCGSLALLALSVPWADGWVVPLSGLGAVLGVVALLWAAWKPCGKRLTALGLGVSLPALLVSSLWPVGHPVPPKVAAAPAASPPLVVHMGQRTGRALVPREGEWADASKDVAQQGDVRVRVQSAEVKRVELGQAKGPRQTSEKYLLIRLRLSNAGTVRIIDYTGWGVTTPEPDTAARLTDSQGKAYRPRVFAPAQKVSGQVRQAAFAPGKWVEDLLVFEAPPLDIKFVHLELPCAACGGKGSLNLEIPRRMIQLR